MRRAAGQQELVLLILWDAAQGWHAESPAAPAPPPVRPKPTCISMPWQRIHHRSMSLERNEAACISAAYHMLSQIVITHGAPGALPGRRCAARAQPHAG